MEFLTTQEQKIYKTAKTRNIINVIIFIFKNDKHINTITLTNEEAKNKLINVLLDKAMNRNATKVKINNVCGNIKAEQKKEHCLQDDTITTYKYVYTFNNIPNTIALY